MNNISNDPITYEFKQTIPIEEGMEGIRLDQFLVQYFEEQYSRAKIQQHIKNGFIRINKRICRSADKLKLNDTVQIDWPKEQTYIPKAQEIKLDILYEDEDMLVVNKQPGLVVHPARGNWAGTLVNALLAYDPKSFEPMLDRWQRPGIVHRLDKDTSGSIIIAKHMDAWHKLKAAFKERLTEKIYLTLVLGGEFGNIIGRFHTLIGRHPISRIKWAVLENNGKEAITNYRVLATHNEISLVQVRIETGRTHQIRVHFSHAMHPVLGDHIYGPTLSKQPIIAKRQMLHAWRITIPHPRTGVMKEFMAPPPDDFKQILQELQFPIIGEKSKTPPNPIITP